MQSGFCVKVTTAKLIKLLANTWFLHRFCLLQIIPKLFMVNNCHPIRSFNKAICFLIPRSFKKWIAKRRMFKQHLLELAFLQMIFKLLLLVFSKTDISKLCQYIGLGDDNIFEVLIFLWTAFHSFHVFSCCSGLEIKISAKESYCTHNRLYFFLKKWQWFMHAKQLVFIFCFRHSWQTQMKRFQNDFSFCTWLMAYNCRA